MVGALMLPFASSVFPGSAAQASSDTKNPSTYILVYHNFKCSRVRPEVFRLDVNGNPLIPLPSDSRTMYHCMAQSPCISMTCSYTSRLDGHTLRLICANFCTLIFRVGLKSFVTQQL
jgi:hypothetical protein